jgi:hypothetical protein
MQELQVCVAASWCLSVPMKYQDCQHIRSCFIAVTARLHLASGCSGDGPCSCLLLGKAQHTEWSIKL